LFIMVNNLPMTEQKMADLWSHCHWLTVLAEQGSYTAAASRLGVSKAAMSQRIAELERVAGVTLVQRTTRSVRLTEAGQRLVDQTRTAFEQISQSFAQVRDLAEAPQGLLRVTAPVALARQQIVPLLPDFLRQYPQVRIELNLSDRLSSLATEGFDLAIRHTAHPPDTHVAVQLCATRSVLVASKAYLRRAGTPTHPHDLATHNCLHYPRPQERPAWTLEPTGTVAAGSARERTTVQVSGSLTANNSEALRDAALSHLGIALLPDFSAQAALQAGKLVEVLPGWTPVGSFADRIVAIRPYAAHVPRAVSLFVDYLRAALKKGFNPSIG
jgi:DNA-binding transcriptional LysR family regulator